jgi:hypothetical protein
MMSFEQIAKEIGELVEVKNKAYGNAFMKSEEFLRLLYPAGIPLGKYGDVLLQVRIFDKIVRVATNPKAFGESPYGDIAGYGILGVAKDDKLQAKQEVAE